MKKLTTYLLILVAFLSSNFVEAQPFNISVSNACFSNSSPSSNTCNAVVTNTMVGAASYTWAVLPSGGTIITPLSGSSGTNATISFTACGVYTVTCFPVDPFGAPIPAAQIISTTTVQCPNWLTMSAANMSVCPGSSVLLSASGATSYSWMGPVTSPVFPYAFQIATLISTSSWAIATPANPGPPTNGYTLSATSALGCSTQSVVFLTLGGPPSNMNPGANPAVACAGSNVTLSAIGATSHTWMPGNIVSASAVVTPTASGCYTVFGNTTAGCMGSNSVCVFINATPTLTINANPGNTICNGSAFSLSALGAMNYTWIPGNFTSANFTVYPTSNICYTVMGVNSMGCVGSAVSCLTVIPQPTLVIAPTTTVCLGTSALLTATGANTYTWSTGTNSPSISVIPLVTTCYSVVGTAVNGCTAMTSGCVVPLNTCSDVWPGDANSDGLVDNTDVFEIGLAFNNTGTARTPGGNTYISQFANNWSGTVSSGKNKCHADCNGDGTINNGDTLAIFNNYSLTHTFKPSETSSVGDINLVTAQTIVNAGQWNKADIEAGSSSSPMNQLYGVAYDINFDKTLIEPDSIYIVYTASFLNNATQNVNFRKTLFSAEIIHSASVRTNGTNVNGNGKIGEVRFKVKAGIADNTQLNLSVSAAKKIGASGTVSNLTGGSTVLSVVNSLTGLRSINPLKNAINLFPNPASKKLTLQSNAGTEIHYTMFDITGREVLNGSFVNSKNIDLCEYAAGAYILRFESDSETTHKKLVIEK